MSAPYSQRKTASNDALLTAFGDWFSRFTATLFGAFLAGVLLLLVVRYYVAQSAAEALQRMDRPTLSVPKK